MTTTLSIEEIKTVSDLIAGTVAKYVRHTKDHNRKALAEIIAAGLEGYIEGKNTKQQEKYEIQNP